MRRSVAHLVRHLRIADLVTRPKLALEALDKLVVPFVVSARATSTLNEEQLAFHVHACVSRSCERRQTFEVRLTEGEEVCIYFENLLGQRPDVVPWTPGIALKRSSTSTQSSTEQRADASSDGHRQCAPEHHAPGTDGGRCAPGSRGERPECAKKQQRAHCD